jgi:DNA-nicking Smr family endonuclease
MDDKKNKNNYEIYWKKSGKQFSDTHESISIKTKNSQNLHGAQNIHNLQKSLDNEAIDSVWQDLFKKEELFLTQVAHSVCSENSSPEHGANFIESAYEIMKFEKSKVKNVEQNYFNPILDQKLLQIFTKDLEYLKEGFNSRQKKSLTPCNSDVSTDLLANSTTKKDKKTTMPISVNLFNNMFTDKFNRAYNKDDFIDFSGKNGLNSRKARAMQGGKWKINAILDLHGYNLEQAETIFSQFIIKNHEQNHRFLLVITGKGNKNQKNYVSLSTAESNETIKAQLIRWMNHKNLRHLILRYSTAHQKHGGSGAFYILLKR